MRFVDTNVLLYAVSREPGEAQRSAVANELLRNRDLCLSAQVLQEFYVQATRATRPDRLTPQQAADLVRAFSRFPVQPTTLALIEAAMDARVRFGLSYWDAAIIEASRAMGCAQVLSEDLSAGEDYGGVVVVNPF